MVLNVQTINDLRCGAVRATSDLFQTFWDADNLDAKLTLSYTVNCGEPEVVQFSIIEQEGYVLIDNTTTYYDIVNSDPTLKLCDGVYCASLVYEPADSSTKVIQYGSTFVDCDIQCQIYDEWDREKFNASSVLYYQLLKDASTCDTCDCSKACLIWSELERLVTGYSNVISYTEYTKISECVPCSKRKKS